MSEAKKTKKPPQNVSIVQIRCPVTLRSAQLAATGQWEESDDPLAYPVGWGRVTIQAVVPNSDYVQHEAQREEHIAAGMAQVQTAEGEAFDAAKTREEIETAFDRIAGEAPPETVTLEIAWDISEDGRRAVLDALAALQFPIGAMPGARMAA